MDMLMDILSHDLQNVVALHALGMRGTLWSSNRTSSVSQSERFQNMVDKDQIDISVLSVKGGINLFIEGRGFSKRGAIVP